MGRTRSIFQYKEIEYYLHIPPCSVMQAILYRHCNLVHFLYHRSHHSFIRNSSNLIYIWLLTSYLHTDPPPFFFSFWTACVHAETSLMSYYSRKSHYFRGIFCQRGQPFYGGSRFLLKTTRDDSALNEFFRLSYMKIKDIVDLTFSLPTERYKWKEMCICEVKVL